MHGPVYYTVVRLATRRELRQQGYRFSEINTAMDGCDDDVIDAAEIVTGVQVGAIGDGKVIQAILDFLKSEQGQQLIAALIQMLLLLIAA